VPTISVSGEISEQIVVMHLAAAASALTHSWQQRLTTEILARGKAETELTLQDQLHKKALAELTKQYDGKLEQVLAAKTAASEGRQSAQLELAALRDKVRELENKLAAANKELTVLRKAARKDDTTTTDAGSAAPVSPA
jgi:chromosome segregation ATPase